MRVLFGKGSKLREIEDRCSSVVLRNEESRNGASLYIFYELSCPFCARLITNTMTLLQNMLRSGVLNQIALIDYLIHMDLLPSVVRVHERLRKIESVEDRLRYIIEMSQRFIEKGPSAFANILVTNVDEDRYRDCMMEARELGVSGTPTTIVYDHGINTGYIIEGFRNGVEYIDAVFTASSKLRERRLYFGK